MTFNNLVIIKKRMNKCSISLFFNLKITYILKKLHLNQIALETIFWSSIKKHDEIEYSYWTKYDIKNGPEKHLHDNGKIWHECFYIKDDLEGPSKFWWPNGQISQECFYIAGKLEGSWKEWSVNGQLEKECFFRNDKRI